MNEFIKNLSSGTTILIISNKETKDIMIIVKSLVLTEIQKSGFLCILLDTLGASLLVDKSVTKASDRVIRIV